MIIEKIIRKLIKAGMKAGLAHPKAKLWAKVNCEDNFALAISDTVNHAMMDVICDLIDAKDMTCVDWFNKESNKEFKKIVRETSRLVYRKLTH